LSLRSEVGDTHEVMMVDGNTSFPSRILGNIWNKLKSLSVHLVSLYCLLEGLVGTKAKKAEVYRPGCFEHGRRILATRVIERTAARAHRSVFAAVVVTKKKKVLYFF